MNVEVHKIYRIKLSGERVFVTKVAENGTVIAKRQCHTHDNGDIYITEHWVAEELETEEDYRVNRAKEGKALAEMLKANGVIVMDDMQFQDQKDPHAN